MGDNENKIGAKNMAILIHVAMWLSIINLKKNAHIEI